MLSLWLGVLRLRLQRVDSVGHQGCRHALHLCLLWLLLLLHLRLRRCLLQLLRLRVVDRSRLRLERLRLRSNASILHL